TCRLPIYPQDPTSAFTASARAPRGNPFRATPVTDQNGSIHRHTQAPQRSGEEAHRMTQRRIGLIGYGDVSVVHVEAIQAIDGLELVGIADTDPAARRRAAAETGVPVFGSVEELLDGVSPDAVHVTTPHDQHVGPSLAALERGVHVLQEKPLAHTLEEASRLVAALEGPTAPRADGGAGAPKVAICFQNRYNRASQELHRLLDSGELGTVRGAYASVVWSRTVEYYANKPWRGRWETAGGGLLINQAIHTLDLV